MNLILKFHLIQIYNFWRHLGLRIQIEIIILFVIFYSFFTSKLIIFFNQILDQPNVTDWGLNGFAIHTFLFIALFSTPFIYFKMIPKQKGLRIFYTQPLSASQTLYSMILYYLKYELIFSSSIYTCFKRSSHLIRNFFCHLRTCYFYLPTHLFDHHYSFFVHKIR